MKATYMWLSRLIALGVVLQAAFIALGTFAIFNEAEDGKVFTKDSEYNAGQSLHSIFGLGIIPLLALLLLIISFFAKVPGGVGLAGGVFGLVVLQILLAIFSFPAPVIGLLHGINAFVIAGVAGLAGKKANESASSSAGAVAAA